MEMHANSSDAPQTRKRLPRAVLVAIIETGMVLGCIVALFTVPDTTRLSTFLFICCGTLILGNILLFRALKKPIDLNRKVEKTDTATQICLFALIFLPLLWSLYEKYGR
jgi:predicted membrane channel-forming protein YqfA (hemolysin III family)